MKNMLSNVTNEACAAHIDSLFGDLARGRFLRIANLWDLNVGPTWSRPPERAGKVDDLRLHIVRSGQGSYWIDGTEIPMVKGLLMFFNPPMMYGHRAEPSDPPSLISCHFELADARTGKAVKPKAPPFFWTCQLELGEYERVLPFFENVSELHRSPVERKFKKELCSSALCQLLGIAQAHCLSGMRENYDSRIEAARLRMEKNPLDSKSFSELASEAGVGAQYFSRIFRKQVGVSPKSYRMKCRMDYANFLLSQGGRAKQVALELGYSDAFVFSHLFKRAFGVSPSEVKKRK